MQSHRRRGDIGTSSHDDFTKTRDTERDILCRVSCQVEGIECHLSGGFSNGLASNHPDGFTWLNDRLQVLDIKCCFKVFPNDNTFGVLFLLFEELVGIRVAVL